MNGAIAEPWVNTTSPPNTAIMTMMGRSQNFFRTFRNRQSSLKNDNPAAFLELVFHRTRFARFPALDPIRRGSRIT